MRVLVTGAAGSVGRIVCSGLAARGHDVVGLDLVGAPAVRPLEELGWHVVDCADPVAVDAVVATAQPDGIVHLAGNPDESALPEALVSHVYTTAALLEAMVRHAVPRLVLASSNHAVGRTPRAALPDGVLTGDARPRPDTFYGVGKVAAEALLSLYADRHGLDTVACRIGSLLDRPTTRRQLSTWLSPEDCVRMVDAALSCPSPGFAVLYGVSANTRGWWDLAPGRALGYQPQDDAEEFAAEVEATRATTSDEIEAAYVGGPYATPEVQRPAF